MGTIFSRGVTPAASTPCQENLFLVLIVRNMRSQSDDEKHYLSPLVQGQGALWVSEHTF